MKKRAIIVVCSLLPLVPGCTSRVEKGRRVQVVRVDTVVAREERRVVSYPGTVEAPVEVNLSFRVGGMIEAIPAREGAAVRRGELLARIDERDLALQLSATTAEYEEARAEAGRVIELYRRGSATASEHDRARHGLTRVEARYRSHVNALADARLVAPVDGHVRAVYLSPGEMVLPGVPVVALVGVGEPEVEIHLPASGYLLRHRFARFTCRVEGTGHFPLELLGIAPGANASRLFRARFRATGLPRDRWPAPGTGATVSIELSPGDGEAAVVSIPASALFGDGGESRAWVYDPATGTVRARRVEVARFGDDGRAVIAGGLEAGEIVVSAGVHALREGERARPLEAPAVTNAGGML